MELVLKFALNEDDPRLPQLLALLGGTPEAPAAADVETPKKRRGRPPKTKEPEPEVTLPAAPEVPTVTEEEIRAKVSGYIGDSDERKTKAWEALKSLGAETFVDLQADRYAEFAAMIDNLVASETATSDVDIFA